MCTLLIGVKLIATRLMRNWPPSCDGDTTGFYTFLSLSLPLPGYCYYYYSVYVVFVEVFLSWHSVCDSQIQLLFMSWQICCVHPSIRVVQIVMQCKLLVSLLIFCWSL